MKSTLNQSQIEFYNSKGYLIIDDLFTDTEIEILRSDSEKFNDLTSLSNVICEDDGTVRSVFAPHKKCDSFNWLYQQERVVKPAQQLLSSEIYLYQFKLNNKKALKGEWWEWHQDFPYWHLDDGVKLPNMLSVMILLQDTNVIQGPLILIPTSHKEGIVEFEFKKHLHDEKINGQDLDLINSLNNDLKYTVNKELIKNYLSKEEVVVAGGSAGTSIFFHANLFHASNANISPFDRNTAIITYNDVNNPPEDRENNRPGYICSRNIEAIKGDDSRLLKSVIKV